MEEEWGPTPDVNQRRATENSECAATIADSVVDFSPTRHPGEVRAMDLKEAGMDQQVASLDDSYKDAVSHVLMSDPSSSITGVAPAHYLNSMATATTSSAKPVDRASQVQYIAMLESENLELNEKALLLERQLGDADRRCQSLQGKNKDLSTQLREEITRGEDYAKGLSASMLQVKAESQKQTTQETGAIRQELELALQKRMELENAFHVQNRTIAELSGDNLKLEEDMKEMETRIKSFQRNSERTEALENELQQSTKRAQELEAMLTKSEAEIKRVQGDHDILLRDSELSTTNMLSQSKQVELVEASYTKSIQEMKKQMAELEMREKKLREETSQKDGALGAMSHDRLQAVHDLVLQEDYNNKLKETCDSLSFQLREVKEWKDKAAMEWAVKTKQWLDVNQEAQETIASLKSMAEDESKRASSLEIEVATLKTNLSHAQQADERLKEELGASRSSLNDSKAKLAEVRNQLHLEKRKSTELEGVRDVLKQQIKRCDTQISDFQATRDQVDRFVQSQSKSLDALTAEHKLLNDSRSALQDELQAATSVRKSMLMEIDLVKKKLLEAQKHAADAKTSNDIMESKMRALEQANAVLTAENIELKYVRKRVVDMEAENMTLQEAKGRLLSELSLSETKAESVETSLKALEGEYNSLRELVKPQTETMEQMAVELKRALDREQQVRTELVSVQAKFHHLTGLGARRSYELPRHTNYSNSSDNF